MNTTSPTIALLNLGGGEIMLILFLFIFLAVLAVGFFGLIYLIIRAVLNRPPPALAMLPPELTIRNQQTRELEQLRLLAIFHFVFGGLALLGIGFLCVHYAILHTVFSNPDTWKNQKDAMPPQAFLDAFIWLYVFMAAMLVTGFVLNLLSGLFLLRKKHRTFSLVVAGLDCLQIPFGTILGIFTIIVLSRDSARQLYSGQAAT